jgi:hypothetical protein
MIEVNELIKRYGFEQRGGLAGAVGIQEPGDGPGRAAEGHAVHLEGDASMAASDWPKLAVALAIWIGLPLAAGLVRLRRREPS